MAINQLIVPKAVLAQGDSIEVQLDIGSEKAFDTVTKIKLYVVRQDGSILDEFVLEQQAGNKKHPKPYLKLTSPKTKNLTMSPEKVKPTKCLDLSLNGQPDPGDYRLTGYMMLSNIRVPLLETKVCIQ